MATRGHTIHGWGLTRVAEWTVDKAQAVETFMNNCRAAEDLAEHYSVKWEDSDHEGHSSWNAWVKTSWVKWKINKLVDHIMEESGCEPHYVMARMNCKVTDDFPTMEAAQVKQVVSIKLADALFAIMTFITTLLVLTWSRYRKVIKRQTSSIEKKAQEAEEQWLAMTAANSQPTLVSIRTYLKTLDSLDYTP
ncbi:hypothetical protein EDB19DRAFT_2036447 [Suillus lakei]|nr:hypothetical protein EDB19DRAFT_2036447 [Suillus lakei]